MSDTQTNTTVVSTSARLPVLVPMLCAVFGSIVTLGGLLVAIGGWRGSVDTHLATIDWRLDRAEANQRTYIPVLVAMQTNLNYLADRARREDERLERGHPK